MRFPWVLPLLGALACASAPRPVTLPLKGPAPEDSAECVGWVQAQVNTCQREERERNAFGAVDGSLPGFGGGAGGRRNASNVRRADRRRRNEACRAVLTEATRQCEQARGASAPSDSLVAAAESGSPAVSEQPESPAAFTPPASPVDSEQPSAPVALETPVTALAAASPPPATAPGCALGGFQRACWGMGVAQVRAVAPGASDVPEAAGVLQERQEIGGLALAVRYHFAQDGLDRVELVPWGEAPSTQAAAEGFRTLRQLLQTRYGSPVALSPEGSRPQDVMLGWNPPGTDVVLHFGPGNAARPLQLLYSRQSKSQVDPADALKL